MLYPRNAITGKEYEGKNIAILLAAGEELDGGKDPRWCTFLQAKQAGWSVKKGEHGTKIAYWKILGGGGEEGDVEIPKSQQGKRRPMAKYFYVFHASQIAGIPAWNE